MRHLFHRRLRSSRQAATRLAVLPLLCATAAIGAAAASATALRITPTTGGARPGAAAKALPGVRGDAPSPLAGGPLAAGPLDWGPTFGSALVGHTPTGNGPSLLAVDPATHTVYVVNGDNVIGPNQGGDTVSVIDTRRCNARDVSRCRGPWPTVTVGTIPIAVAVDRVTDTVYVVAAGDFVDPGTVSVFAGATCNAEDQRGCGRVATVPVGIIPVGVDADSANHTVYVANAGDPAGTVSMIDSATCNGADLAACPTTEPPTVTVGPGPDAFAIDRATHTVYVAEIGGVAVLGADTCNATTQAGCGSMGTLSLGNGDGPFDLAVNPANATLYTANGDDTISAFDLTRCTAADLNDCATVTPGTVTIPTPPGFDAALAVAVDGVNHTVYVALAHDDALAAFDARACDGADPSGCATVTLREIRTATEPESVRLDPRTQTLYTGDEVDDVVSVLDPARCGATTDAGCRPVPPTIAFPASTVPVDDPAVHTLYDPSVTAGIGMLDTAVCNAHHPWRCPATPVTIAGGDQPFSAITDPLTHTVYVANAGNGSDGSVTVFDDRTCNAVTQAGCAGASTLTVPAPAEPIAVDVDLATDSVYVATDAHGLGLPTFLYVYDGATCNATVRTGCGQAPAAAVPLGVGGPSGVAVDQATHTVYASVIKAFGTDTSGEVAVIDGLTCNATNVTGCAAPIAELTVGVDPQQVGIDQATDTVYTANEADTDYQGTASILNGATCNSLQRADCGQTATTVPVGFGPIDLWVDQARNEVWIDNAQDTSASIIDGAVCNGTDEAACARPWPKRSVLDYPNATAFADSSDTAYVGGLTGISVLPLGEGRGRPRSAPRSLRPSHQ